VNLDWVGATLRLLRAFAEAGGRRAVLAGSCAEYAWGEAGPLREDASPLRPATLYGACKHATRLAAEGYAAQEALSLAWGRIFFSFGPGEAPGRLIPAVAGALLHGEVAPVTTGEQVRDFLAVEELADAFAALLDSGVEGPVNLASGEGVSVRDVVAAVGRAAGREDLIRYGALPTRPGDPPEIVADVGRLRDEVGWAARESLEAGIERAVAALHGRDPASR
jgi:nucleoside-diphosphate-sugar epimerase